MAAAFVPRAAFPALENLPRSYFLGHHRAGLREMQRILSSIDLIIECRDYRVPITSRNPLLESSLAGKERMIVYTKHDLATNDPRRDNVISKWHAPTTVLFSDIRSPKAVNTVLEFAKERARAMDTLTGARMLVAGMPNVGKSSLLNVLRRAGQNKKKVARTGAQPGITRTVNQEVRIAGSPKTGDGIYLVDTPGVFIPYVPDPEAMLKLALCGLVKDTIIPPTILADYLLYCMNLADPALYRTYSEPTNNIEQLLDLAAKHTGRLQKGGVSDMEATAIWLVQRWRTGHFGQFILDTVDENSLQRKIAEEEQAMGSISQARRAARQEAKTRLASKQKATLSIPM